MFFSVDISYSKHGAFPIAQRFVIL